MVNKHHVNVYVKQSNAQMEEPDMHTKLHIAVKRKIYIFCCKLVQLSGL